MAIFRIQLIEKTTVSSEASFRVNSFSVEAAAAEVLLAYHKAQDDETSVILLKDGQREMLAWKIHQGG